MEELVQGGLNQIGGEETSAGVEGSEEKNDENEKIKLQSVIL